MIIKTSDGNNDNNNHHHHHHARVRATKEGGVSVCSCDPGSVWVTQDAHLLRFTTSTSSRKRHPATLVPTQGEGGGRHRRWIPSTRLPAPPPHTHTPHPPLTPASLPLPHTHAHTILLLFRLPPLVLGWISLIYRRVPFPEETLPTKERRGPGGSVVEGGRGRERARDPLLW